MIKNLSTPSSELHISFVVLQIDTKNSATGGLRDCRKHCTKFASSSHAVLMNFAMRWSQFSVDAPPPQHLWWVENDWKIGEFEDEFIIMLIKTLWHNSSFVLWSFSNWNITIYVLRQPKTTTQMLVITNNHEIDCRFHSVL